MSVSVTGFYTHDHLAVSMHWEMPLTLNLSPLRAGYLFSVAAGVPPAVEPGILPGGLSCGLCRHFRTQSPYSGRQNAALYARPVACRDSIGQPKPHSRLARLAARHTTAGLRCGLSLASFSPMNLEDNVGDII